MADNPYGIPQAINAHAEENIRQAHAAYEELTDYVNKAMGAWMGAMSADSMATRFKDVQDRTMDFAKDNAESAFTFAGKVCNTQTPQELFTLQTQFAHDRIHAFVTHTQELYSLIEKSREAIT